MLDLPEAARELIVKLRVDDRPYSKPPWVSITNSLGSLLPTKPALPADLGLREYQQQAIDAWFANKNRGIFEMATGTGKTITALAAIVRLLEETKRLVIVVACPYKHLVEQWADEAEHFGFRPVRVAESSAQWAPDVSQLVQGFSRKRSDIVFIITTIASLQRGKLPAILEKVWGNSLLVVDEAHHAGAPRMLAALPTSAPYRLGLSATPIRHYDVDGTEAILNYFGDVIYQFGLEKAIGTFLTPYFYHPIPVEMTIDEFEEFCDLTRKLQRALQRKDQDGTASDMAEKLAFKRARVLNNSVAKLNWVRDNVEMYAKIEHTLFYVGDALFEQVRQLLGVEKRLRIHEFTERQTNRERREILARFAARDLQALVAMKCLDEGVDVPPTRVAYFLASSGNPREFVQRRGRVLRKAEGKTHATLYDLIATPPTDFIEAGDSHPDYSAVRAVIRREYRRIKEFASLAQNHYQALDQLFPIVDKLGLLDT